MGQCSLTVALPIISACGVETCVLPSAVLSTHTGGFTGFTFRDLTEDMPSINNHWQKEGIKFDAVYTGYLGSAKQIEYVKEIVATSKKEAAPFIVDPAMADNGKLYAGFDDAFVQEMKELCRVADYVLPNITEACLLTDTEYKEEYDRVYIDEAHLFFKNQYSADFLLKAWKRFRKYGGLLTGITQNISDCLLNETARGMLSNSEFLLMLNQSPSDRKDLSELLNISDTQMSYITNAGAGRGLIKVGGSIVPFVNDFPTDTELYKLMSTKPGEG